MLTENKRLTYEETFAIADETWCNMLYKQKEENRVIGTKS